MGLADYDPPPIAPELWPCHCRAITNIQSIHRLCPVTLQRRSPFASAAVSAVAEAALRSPLPLVPPLASSMHAATQ